MTQLYLIRHAHASHQDRQFPDDTKRPLSEKGINQAKNLAALFEKRAIKLDFLFSSPYTRAAQTAEPLSICLHKNRYIQYLDSLAHHDFSQLLAELKAWTGEQASHLALVGHEPYLGELANLLLSQGSDRFHIPFKKAAILSMHGALEAGEMTLDAYLPHSWYKHF